MHTRLAIAKTLSLVAAVGFAVSLVLACLAPAFAPPCDPAYCDIPTTYGFYFLLTGALAVATAAAAAVAWAVYLLRDRPTDARLSGAWTQVLKVDAVLLLATAPIGWISTGSPSWALFLTAMATLALVGRRIVQAKQPFSRPG